MCIKKNDDKGNNREGFRVSLGEIRLDIVLIFHKIYCRKREMKKQRRGKDREEDNKKET